jgi:hypothetical protein
MTTATSWQHNPQYHSSLHDPGAALRSRDPTRRPSNRRAVACASDAPAHTTHAGGLGAGATTEAPEAATQRCYSYRSATWAAG